VSPHGTRARYKHDACRCEPCRAANTAYYRAERARHRAGAPLAAPFVDAAPVAEHLRELARQGIGYPTVAAATDLTAAHVWKIRAGWRKTMRASTAARILAVDLSAASDACRIDARPTWKLIRELLAAGLTRREIATRLSGRYRRALTLARRRVEARTAFLVRRLHAEVMAELAQEKALPAICPECCFSHAPEERHAVIRRMLPCSTEDLREAHPCWWSGGAAPEMRMYRDLHIVGAERVDGGWALPERREAHAA
jgi:hypothetical protein